MSQILNYELIKLYFKNNLWVVEYQGDDSLCYEDPYDAMVSLGILAKELSKIMKFPLKILIFDTQHKLVKENYLFPALYKAERKFFKKSLLKNIW